MAQHHVVDLSISIRDFDSLNDAAIVGNLYLHSGIVFETEQIDAFAFGGYAESLFSNLHLLSGNDNQFDFFATTSISL